MESTLVLETFGPGHTATCDDYIAAITIGEERGLPDSYLDTCLETALLLVSRPVAKRVISCPACGGEGSTPGKARCLHCLGFGLIPRTHPASVPA